MSTCTPTTPLRPLAFACLLALACARDQGSEPRLRATVTRPVTDTTSDTVSFEADAVALRCDDGSGTLFLGTAGPDGVLVLLRPGDSPPSGAYSALQRGDSTTPRGALVVARFFVADIARGGVVDSGIVTAREDQGWWHLTARGSGVGVPGAMRFTLEAEFERLAAPTDTTSCAIEP